MGVLQDLIDDKFGIATQTNEGLVSVIPNAVITKFLNNNGDRLSFIIINLGSNNMYITPDPQPASNRGILVAPSGGNLSLIYSEDFELVGREWFALAVGGANNIYVLEVEAS